MRPEGPKKIFLRPGPPLSQGLDIARVCYSLPDPTLACTETNSILYYLRRFEALKSNKSKRILMSNAMCLILKRSFLVRICQPPFPPI